jgi:putative endonuclease
VNRGERRARLFYLLRGYRLLDANVHVGGYELDLVVRRGKRVVVVEVKEKGGDGFGDPLEMVGPEKRRRVRAGARAWLAAHPQYASAEVALEAVGVRGRRVERVTIV